mgnify:CR=1 FL=1
MPSRNGLDCKFVHIFISCDVPIRNSDFVGNHCCSVVMCHVSSRYVVIGGGKTGLDTVQHIHRHKRDMDEVMLVTGRSKLFLKRDTIFPPYEEMLAGQFSPYTLGDLKLDLTLAWDGTNEEVGTACCVLACRPLSVTDPPLLSTGLVVRSTRRRRDVCTQ